MVVQGELKRRPGPAVQDVSVLVQDAHPAGSTNPNHEEGGPQTLQRTVVQLRH